MRGKASRRQSAILMDTAASGVACFLPNSLKKAVLPARVGTSEDLGLTWKSYACDHFIVMKARYTRKR